MISPKPLDLLVVDDETPTRTFLYEHFTDLGYEVEIADSGKTALAAVKRRLPYLVLMDVNMPEMDGMQALEEMKKYNSTLKVIMVTGNEEREIVEKILFLGAESYVVKPFTLDDLTKQVKAILSRRKN